MYIYTLQFLYNKSGGITPDKLNLELLSDTCVRAGEFVSHHRLSSIQKAKRSEELYSLSRVLRTSLSDSNIQSFFYHFASKRTNEKEKGREKQSIAAKKTMSIYASLQI